MIIKIQHSLQKVRNMSQLDRLSALVAHVDIQASALSGPENGNIALVHSDGAARTLLLWRRPEEMPKVRPEGMLSLRLEFGGANNPLCHALPKTIKVDLSEAPGVRRIAELLRDEVTTPRCGGAFALERLSELLLISLLRNQIEQVGTETGLLAGLAHPGLARVLVAMHDDPGRGWRVEDFLPIAGMSRSQFMSSFQETVGKTPMAYLKAWRMGLARTAILRGDRISSVARRYGYRSSDAFSRAFSIAYGVAPTHLRGEHYVPS